jgi:hypothetical protein
MTDDEREIADLEAELADLTQIERHRATHGKDIEPIRIARASIFDELQRRSPPRKG